jgi:hypothetical protein
MATNRAKNGDPAAIAALRDRLMLTLQFMERAQDFPSGPKMREIVVRAAEQGDYRNLRLMAKEVDAMTIALAPHERDGLEALLSSRLGIDKDAERDEMRRKVAVALQRGTVASEKERRRLEEYVEMLEASGDAPAEAAAVKRLLRSG